MAKNKEQPTKTFTVFGEFHLASRVWRKITIEARDLKHAKEIMEDDEKQQELYEGEEVNTKFDQDDLEKMEIEEGDVEE